nr:SOS response-associated peptidase family protein [uncultured Psychroserpens sp.]
MFYKLSNTCKLKDIEKEFKTVFKYPHLYEPKAIINGLEESNLPIITAENSSRVDFAIWGLLPQDYEEEWETFQGYTNTLNTNIDDVNLKQGIYSKSQDERRCLIVVNGFFTSKLINGKLQTFHVHLKNHKPFCIAGIYNIVNDGFLTCSLLVTNIGYTFNSIPNLGKQKPLIFKKKDHEKWLDPELDFKDLQSLIKTHERYEFLSHPIKEDFYNNTKIFKRIVNSDQYNTIMKVSRD